jgi:hypothetical protein
MRRSLLPLLFLFLWTCAAVAQFGSTAQPSVRLRGRSFADLYAAQKVLLSNYCRLDFEGARLQSAGWSRFKPYTSLRVNPEFTSVVVVTRFDIEGQQQPSEMLYANYQAVGIYDESEGYTAAASSERVAFRIQEQGDSLLVSEISPETPHVSPRAAIAWMTLRISDPKTSELERAHLKDALEQLNKSQTQPHPATKP